jgi:hypothetical protein
MKALALANAALSLKQAGDAIAAGQSKEGGNAADQAGGIGIRISLGSSRSQSNNSQSSDRTRSSSVIAGGAGANSAVPLQGSAVKAGGTVRLSAEDEVKLLAAANTAQEKSSSNNSSGVRDAQMGVTLSASAVKGQGSGTAPRTPTPRSAARACRSSRAATPPSAAPNCWPRRYLRTPGGAAVLALRSVAGIHVASCIKRITQGRPGLGRL